ncbi:hypothetical protein PG991_003085 [Apiospora marii]|uniref:Uncharacterized protein n=1 Tax=Apiospora marii TaxID=335849 RepID=A0ABR1SH85_9PEZI
MPADQHFADQDLAGHIHADQMPADQHFADQNLADQHHVTAYSTTSLLSPCVLEKNIYNYKVASEVSGFGGEPRAYPLHHYIDREVQRAEIRPVLIRRWQGCWRTPYAVHAEA